MCLYAVLHELSDDSLLDIYHILAKLILTLYHSIHYIHNVFIHLQILIECVAFSLHSLCFLVLIFGSMILL
jgi:hypothetical protein